MFMTKKKHEAILSSKEKELTEQMEALSEAEARLKKAENDLVECYRIMGGMKNQINVLQEDADKNSVEIRIDDTITTGTPIVRYKQTVIDKLVEEGYLREGNTDQFAIQLALITISQEILTQLVESFTEAVASD